MKVLCPDLNIKNPEKGNGNINDVWVYETNVKNRLKGIEIMVHEEKKVAKIIEELTMFFFSLGADEIETRIKRKDNTDIIWFSSNFELEYKEELHYLGKYLNKEKNDGLEDIYWELVGSGDPGESSQLLLIGMMIDKAEIKIENTKVELKLFKEIKEGY